jgi:hypothetical protein
MPRVDPAYSIWEAFPPNLGARSGAAMRKKRTGKTKSKPPKRDRALHLGLPSRVIVNEYTLSDQRLNWSIRTGHL